MTGEHCAPASVKGLPRARAAIAFAERVHAGQIRADGTPFIRHPLEVASLLRDAGAPDELVAAGALHDVIEKAGVAAQELRRRFGARIAGLVLAVSDDARIEGYARRKAALRSQVAALGDEALMLFAADKLSKVRELSAEAAASRRTREPVRVRRLQARRVRHYQRSLALLEERLPEWPLVHDLRAELSALLRASPALASGY